MKESLPKPSQEILDVKTLSADGKVRYLMEIFDLGKDKEKNEERKENFKNLMKEYKRLVDSRYATRKRIEESDIERQKIHDKIMDIVIKMSLSVGLDPSQRKLVEYLAEDRVNVEEMIMSYFKNYNTGDSSQYSEVRQALRGEGAFQFSGKEDE